MPRINLVLSRETFDKLNHFDKVFLNHQLGVAVAFRIDIYHPLDIKQSNIEIKWDIWEEGIDMSDLGIEILFSTGNHIGKEGFNPTPEQLIDITDSVDSFIRESIFPKVSFLSTTSTWTIPLLNAVWKCSKQ